MAAARQKTTVINTRHYCVTYIQAYSSYWEPYLFEQYDVNAALPGDGRNYDAYSPSFLHAGVDAARYDFIVYLLQQPGFNFEKFVNVGGEHHKTKKPFKSIFDYIWDNYFERDLSLHDNAVHRDFIEKVFFLLLIHDADPNLLLYARSYVSRYAVGFDHFQAWKKSKSLESAAAIAQLIKQKNDPCLNGYYNVWLQRSIKPFSKEWFEQYARIYSTVARVEEKELVIKELQDIINSKPQVADEKKGEEKAAAEPQEESVNAIRAEIILARIFASDSKAQEAILHFSNTYEKLIKLPKENFTPDEILEAHIFYLINSEDINALNKFLSESIDQITPGVLERGIAVLQKIDCKITQTICNFYLAKLTVKNEFRTQAELAKTALQNNPIFAALRDYFGWDGAPINRWKAVAVLQEEADRYFNQQDYSKAFYLYNHNKDIYRGLVTDVKDVEVYKKYLLQVENYFISLVNLNYIQYLPAINEIFLNIDSRSPDELNLLKDLTIKLYFYAASKPELQKELLKIFETKMIEANPVLSRLIAEALLVMYATIPVQDDSPANIKILLAKVEVLKPFVKGEDAKNIEIIIKNIEIILERCYAALGDAESLENAYQLSHNPHVLFKLGAAHVQDEKQIAKGIEELRRTLMNVNEERLFLLATTALLKTRETAIPYIQKIDEALLEAYRSRHRWNYMDSLQALTFKLLKAQPKISIEVLDNIIRVILFEIDLEKEKELFSLMGQHYKDKPKDHPIKLLIEKRAIHQQLTKQALQNEVNQKKDNLVALDSLAARIFKINIRRRLVISTILILITNDCKKTNNRFNLPLSIIKSIRNRSLAFIKSIKNQKKHRYAVLAEACFTLCIDVMKCPSASITDYLSFFATACPIYFCNDNSAKNLLTGINEGLGHRWGSWGNPSQDAAREFNNFRNLLAKAKDKSRVKAIKPTEEKSEDGRAAAPVFESRPGAVIPPADTNPDAEEWEQMPDADEPGLVLPAIPQASAPPAAAFFEGAALPQRPAAAAPLASSALAPDFSDEGQPPPYRPSSPGQ